MSVEKRRLSKAQADKIVEIFARAFRIPEAEFQSTPPVEVEMEGLKKSLKVRLTMNRGGRQAEIVQEDARYGIQCTMMSDSKVFINTSASNPHGAYFMTEEERLEINRKLSQEINQLPEVEL